MGTIEHPTCKFCGVVLGAPCETEAYAKNCPYYPMEKKEKPKMEQGTQTPPPKMAVGPKGVLLEAHDLIHGHRERDYGNPLENFSHIASLWSALLRHPVTPEEVSLCMALVKMARLQKTPDHRDSIVDMAGYAGCYDRIQLLKRGHPNG